MSLFVYSRWDGSQDVFPVHEEDVLEQLAENMMPHGDVSAALRSMSQRGLRGRNGEHLKGLQDMVQRLRQRRQEFLDRYNLNDILERVREELSEIKGLERQGIDERRREAAEKLQRLQSDGQGAGLQADLLRKLEQIAQKNQAFLDALPADPAPALQQLSGYEFMAPEAQRRFDDLMKRLQQQVLGSTVDRMSEQLQRLSPQDTGRMKEMLRRLNQMLEEKAKGGQPDFQSFMRQFGDLFGSERPSSLEELVQWLQQQAAQMESLFSSLAPEQRRQLRKALESALGDPELSGELARLAANLEALQPGNPWHREYPFQGSEGLDLEAGLDVMRRLQRLDEMERQLKRSQQGANLGEVDQAMLQELLGQDALHDLQRLQQLVKMLEESGYLVTVGGCSQLTPKGVRKVGQKALREIFSTIKRDRAGRHATSKTGVGVELGDGTKRYEFGDPLALDLQKTVFNALGRGGGSLPLQLHPDDFEVHRTYEQQQSASVLMIDLSLSMAMRGSFMAAKKVALALDNLIRTQFPRDAFHIVGFSTYAREIKAERLAYLSWDELDPYTNIQHGLALAQKLLSKVSGGTKQIIMVSDGEPTAHLEDGHLYLQYPPSPRTIRETLREVKRCTGRGITINTFMLDRNAHLVDFVAQMTRINRGRVFYTSPDRLGQYVLVDYLTSRRRVLSA